MKNFIFSIFFFFALIATASASNFVVADGSGECTDNPFAGKVPDAALVVSGGVAVEVIEVHDRFGEGKGADKRFKTKRLLVTPDGIATAMAFTINGECANVKSSSRLSENEISQTLLNSGETLRAFDAHASKGEHGTVATFVVVPAS
jgi:hypothetical protein